MSVWNSTFFFALTIELKPFVSATGFVARFVPYNNEDNENEMGNTSSH